jgi:exopolysaccharide biosynthesis polyprenyl glycosylphosphotransferase
VFAHQRKRVDLLFAAADGLLTSAAFAAAYYTRRRLALGRQFYELHDTPIEVLFVVSIAIWVALGLRSGAYEHLASARLSRIVTRTLRQCVLGTAALVLFEYVARLDLSRPFLALLFGYDLVLLLIFRLNAVRMVRAFRGFGAPYHVVVVGPPSESERYGRMLVEGSAFRVELTAVIPENECVERLPRLLEQQVVDEIIFRIDSRRLTQLEDILELCDEEGVRTRLALDFLPHVNSDISLDYVGEERLLTFTAGPSDDLRLLVKRLIDVLVSATALIVLAPPMLLVAALIRVTSRGPVIFRQVRCGLNGRRFVFYKFRSMVENAEALQADLAHLNSKQTAFKIPDDPRLTPAGRWLRKFSIDEWPQFFNVLKGDMSLVGPRPPVPQEVERYQRWQRRRLRMRPGLTCLWAVRGRDQLDFESWMKMDMEYIDRWSLRLDFEILLRSVPQVMSGQGAH